MKTLNLIIGAAVFVGLSAITPNLSFGQIPVETRTTTTTTSSGTVSEFTPNVIAVKVAASPVPVRYTFTKTTTYVDESGNPVSLETVKTGAPVMVYYEKRSDGFVADKVVVRKSVSTTTDESPSMAPAPLPMPPSAMGTITEANSDEISIQTDSAGPGRYEVHESTACVDENGNPVARSGLKAGTPVTVFFEREGDHLRATRVVVRSPAVIEKSTTTSQETVVPQ